MKKSLFKIFLLTLVTVFVLVACNRSVQSDQTVYLIDITAGQVDVSKDTGKTWQSAEVGMELSQNDTIRTGSDSFCDIIMPERGVFRVTFNSVVSLKELGKSAERLDVQKGKIVLNITEKLKDNETFEVETQTAVAAVRGTEFVIDFQGGKMTARVKTGEVAVRRNIDRAVANAAIRRNIVRHLEVRIRPSQKIVLDKTGTEKALKQLEKNSSTEEEALKVANSVKQSDEEKISKDDEENLNKEFVPLEKMDKVQKVKKKVKELKRKYHQNKGNSSEKDKKSLDKFKNGIKKKAGLSSTADKKVGPSSTTIGQDIKDKVADKKADAVNKRAGLTGIAKKKVGDTTTTLEQDKKDKVVEKVADKAQQRSGQTGLADKIMNNTPQSASSESDESAADRKMREMKERIKSGKNKFKHKIKLPGE